MNRAAVHSVGKHELLSGKKMSRSGGSLANGCKSSLKTGMHLDVFGVRSHLTLSLSLRVLLLQPLSPCDVTAFTFFANNSACTSSSWSPGGTVCVHVDQSFLVSRTPASLASQPETMSQTHASRRRSNHTCFGERVSMPNGREREKERH